jgi:hypothetical protein
MKVTLEDVGKLLVQSMGTALVLTLVVWAALP